ncbi:MAG TPA: NACHT domain-containing protein [Allocoleopsis sp.]
MTGFEPFAPAAVSDVVLPIYQALWGGGGKVLGLFGSALDEETQKVICAACKQYEQNFVERHGSLKVLGMREPLPLDSVYSDVQFLDIRAIPSFESVETREAAYRQSQQRRDKDYPKLEGLKVANDKQYLMVLGSPGAGKSTFLQWMGLEALKAKKGKFKHACIPALIELKTIYGGEINIDEAIAQELYRCGFPSHQEFTDQALEQGKLLILLDGLDEVPTEQMNEAIDQIQKFVDLYHQNRFIVSCRMAEYRYHSRRFTEVAIADLDEAQIEQSIANWFSREPQKGQDCWQQLNQPEHQGAKALTSTPLFLTLICSLYQQSFSFPMNRANLYERCLRIALEQGVQSKLVAGRRGDGETGGWGDGEMGRWGDEESFQMGQQSSLSSPEPQSPTVQLTTDDHTLVCQAVEQDIVRQNHNQGLNPKQKEKILSRIAHDAFQADRLFLPEQELMAQLEQGLGEILADEMFVDSTGVGTSIELQPETLMTLAQGIYSFAHLTLQEYLTAQYIDNHQQIDRLVAEHLTDNRWREVFLLLAEIMGSRTDELLLSIEKAAQTYINTPKLQALLHWADRATTGSEGNLSPAAKRALAIAKAKAYGISRSDAYSSVYADIDTDVLADALVEAKAYTIANANAIAQAKAYARSDVIGDTVAYIGELEKLKIFKDVDFAGLIAKLEALKTGAPSDEHSPKSRQAFAHYIVQSWLDALHLSPELVNLSTDEAEALRNYFYAHWLMVQCKQAAMSVSPKVWEAIEERMLLYEFR